MAKQIKKHPNKKAKQKERKTFLGTLDSFFSKRLNLFFYISLGLTVIFGILLFNLRISEGGDDSLYIENAKRFIEGQSFPTHLGSFYPIFLSLPLMVFGINLFILKFFSFLFIVGHLLFFYLALKKRVSSTFLVASLLFCGLNSFFLYYASQTYSEALFLFLQAITFFYFFKVVDIVENKENINYKFDKSWILLGLFMFLMSITRMIGHGVIIAVAAYFLINKQFRASLYSVISPFIFYIPYLIYKRIIWGASDSGRIEKIFYKNYYNPSAGSENLEGMWQRIIDNSNIYLSKHIPTILGFREETLLESLPWVTLFIYALFAVSLYFAFKEKKRHLFIGLYMTILIGGTFFTLQQVWGQVRLILIYMPLLIIFISWGIVELSKNLKIKILPIGLIIFLFVILFKSLGITIQKAEANNRILSKNMSGDKYFGYTPDWQNFLRISEWASKNLPDTATIASRKPSMSFIYGNGRNFFGVYRFLIYNTQELLNAVKEKHNDIIAFDMLKLRESKLPRQFQYFLGNNNVGFIYNNSSSYILINKNTPSRDIIINELDSHNFEYSPSYEDFYNNISSEIDQYNSTSSDSLLHFLYKNDVDYIIRASLRVNPKQKTNRTINTVARFMYYIELKYPGIFTLVQQFGKDNEEPAYLFQVNYGRYNINNRSFK